MVAVCDPVPAHRQRAKERVDARSDDRGLHHVQRFRET